MGETFADIAATGPLLLGVAVAAVAGLVSFFSPCILPLVPGYLAYVTGLSGADADSDADARQDRRRSGVTAPTGARVGAVAPQLRQRPPQQQPQPQPQPQRRVLAGTLLFVAGFGAVFITTSVVAASVGRALQEQQRALEITGGVLMIVFALALLGLVPLMQREVRIRRLPAAGLAGAPVFGAVFALSWIPCVGPTLGAVLALGLISGQTGRAAVLASAYTLGIGLPFLAFGLGLRWFIGAVGVIRRHGAWVTRIGAILLVAVGVALLTGAWDGFVSWLRVNVGLGEVFV